MLARGVPTPASGPLERVILPPTGPSVFLETAAVKLVYGTLSMTSASLGLNNPALLKDKCYVAGEWIGGAATIPVTNPVDDSVIGQVPKLGAAETRRAIEAAEKAQKTLGERRPPRSAASSCASGST